MHVSTHACVCMCVHVYMCKCMYIKFCVCIYDTAQSNVALLNIFRQVTNMHRMRVK